MPPYFPDVSQDDDVLAAALGVPPPDLPAYDEPGTFTASPYEHALELLAGSMQNVQIPRPRNFQQGLGVGLIQGFGGAGQKIATAREQFRQKNEARRLATDAARKKATEEYRANKQKAVQGYLGEERKAARDTAADLVDVGPELVAQFPQLEAWSGKKIPKSTLDRLTVGTKAKSGISSGGESDEPIPLEGDALDMAAYMYRITGQMPPGVGRGKQGPADIRKIITRAAHLPPNFQPGVNLPANVASYKGRSSALTAMTKMHEGAKAFINTVEKNSNRLRQAMKGLPDTGTEFGNAMLRPMLRKLGSAKLAEFNTALATVQPEFQRILNSPGMTGVNTVEGKKEMQAVLSGNFTRKQLEVALNVLHQDAENRVSSYDEAIRALTEAAGGVAPSPSPGGGVDLGQFVRP